MHKSGTCSDGKADLAAGGQVCGLPRPHRAGADLPSEIGCHFSKRFYSQ